MNNHITKRAMQICSFLLFLLLILSNTLHSQEKRVDTIAFLKAQKKIDNCSSGAINYRLNYVTSNFELYWDIELYFIKKKEKIYYYVKLVEDTLISEYVYYNDILLILGRDANQTTYHKQRTNRPFSGNIKRVFTYLLDEHDLTNFLSYDKVILYDTILHSSQNNGIVGEASTFTDGAQMNGQYKSKIIINKENNNLISCSNTVVVYKDSTLFHKAKQEYIIDTISLYKIKKRYIKNIIKTKYCELDSIIVPNIEIKKEPLKKEPLKEIPKFAYEWKLPFTNGDTLYSKDIDSKILVLDFYYMSCAPCIMEIIDLIKLDSLYNENDVTFVGMNVYDNNLTKIDKFLVGRKVKYRNVINAKILSDKYGFNSFPQTLFIDTKTNEILYHFSGYRSDSFEHYKNILDELLDK